MGRAVFPKFLPRRRLEILGNCGNCKALIRHNRPDSLCLLISTVPPLRKFGRQETANIVGTVGSYRNTTCGYRKIGAFTVKPPR